MGSRFRRRRVAAAAGTLTGVGVGWFDVYPRFLLEGRLIGEAELREGANVVVLDEPLAFAIFQGAEAVGSQLQIGGIWYEVIGVVRHTRQVGDTDAMGAYVPIPAAGAGFCADGRGDAFRRAHPGDGRDDVLHRGGGELALRRRFLRSF